MGKFGKYLKKLDCKVDGEELSLEVKLKHTQKIQSFKKDDITEDSLKGLNDVLIDIMVLSYPSEPKDEMEAFVLKNGTALMNEVIIGLGWVTREDLEKAQKKLMESN